MGRIAELWAKVSSSFSDKEAQGESVMVEDVDVDLLRQRIIETESILTMMHTAGWKLYVRNVRQLREDRVNELLSMTAERDNSARCLHTGATKGLDDALEVAEALIAAGEMAEQQLEKVTGQSEQYETDKSNVTVVSRV